MNEITTYSVSDVNNFIKNILEDNNNLKNIAIKGEISNLTHHHTGHIYLSLKDDKSKINGIIFSFNAKNLKIKLEAGMNIIAIGSITAYVPNGTYTFQIKSVMADGIGILYQKFQLLKEKLQKLGWFDPSIKKSLPNFANKIGIITADTGAAIKDIITTLKRRYPLAEIYLFACLVQGPNAAANIVKQINNANNFNPKLDVLIVGRGGGSIEDLWAFNEEIVAEAIYKSKIPIISAVGHEIDFTIADFVADIRAATPTAAAELASPNISELKQYLIQQEKILFNLFQSKFILKKKQLQQINDNYLLKNPLNILNKFKQIFEATNIQFINQKNNFITTQKQKIEKIKIKIYYQTKKTYENSEQKLIYIKKNFKFSYNKYWSNTKNNFQQLISKLEILSPLKTLERGYSITKDGNDVIKSIKNIKLDQTITTRVNDGIILSTVKKIEKIG